MNVLEKEKSMQIAFGDKAMDTVTRFSGTVTAMAYYATGCNQALIQPEVTKDGAWQDAQWFDFERLDIVAAKAMKIRKTSSGGPRGSDAAPVR